MSNEPIQNKDSVYCPECDEFIPPDTKCECGQLSSHKEISHFLSSLQHDAMEEPYTKLINTLSLVYDDLIDIVMDIADKSDSPSDTIINQLRCTDEVSAFLLDEYNRRTL